MEQRQEELEKEIHKDKFKKIKEETIEQQAKHLFKLAIKQKTSDDLAKLVTQLGIDHFQICKQMVNYGVLWKNISNDKKIDMKFKIKISLENKKVTWNHLDIAEKPELEKLMKDLKVPHNRLNTFCITDQEYRIRIINFILSNNPKEDLMVFFNSKIKPAVKGRKITATHTDVLQQIRFAIQKFSELQNLDINNIHLDILEELQKEIDLTQDETGLEPNFKLEAKRSDQSQVARVNENGILNIDLYIIFVIIYLFQIQSSAQCASRLLTTYNFYNLVNVKSQKAD